MPYRYVRRMCAPQFTTPVPSNRQGTIRVRCRLRSAAAFGLDGAAFFDASRAAIRLREMGAKKMPTSPSESGPCEQPGSPSP